MWPEWIRSKQPFVNPIFRLSFLHLFTVLLILFLFNILIKFFELIDFINSALVKEAVPDFFTTILAPILAKLAESI